MNLGEDFVAHRIGPPPKTLRKLSRNEELAVGYAAEVAWRVREEAVASKSPLTSIPISVKRSTSSNTNTSFSSVILNNPPPSPCSAVPKPTPRSASGLSLPSDVHPPTEYGRHQPDGFFLRRRTVGSQLPAREREVSLPSELNTTTPSNGHHPDSPSPGEGCDAVEVLPSLRSVDAVRRCLPLRDRLTESKSAILAALLNSSPDNSHRKHSAGRTEAATSTNRHPSEGSSAHHELEAQLVKSQQTLNQSLRKQQPTTRRRKSTDTNESVTRMSPSESVGSAFELECQLSQSQAVLSRALAKGHPPSLAPSPSPSLCPQRVSSSISALSSALSSLKGTGSDVFTCPRSSASMLEDELKRVEEQTHTSEWEVATTWEEAKALQQQSEKPKGGEETQSSVPKQFVAPRRQKQEPSAVCRCLIQEAPPPPPPPPPPPSVNVRSVTTATSSSVSWSKPAAAEGRRAFTNLDVNLVYGKQPNVKKPLPAESPASRALEEELTVAQRRLRSRTEDTHTPHNTHSTHTCWY